MYDGILPFHRATAPNFAYDKKGGSSWGRIYYIVGFFLLYTYHIISLSTGGSTDTILNFLLLETFSLIYLYKEIALRHFFPKISMRSRP